MILIVYQGDLEIPLIKSFIVLFLSRMSENHIFLLPTQVGKFRYFHGSSTYRFFQRAAVVSFQFLFINYIHDIDLYRGAVKL